MPTTISASGRRTSGAVALAPSREARLRPEWSDLYPGLIAGRWEPAAIVADRLLAYGLMHGSHTALRGRALLDAHFEFRGGDAARDGERIGIRLGSGEY